MVWATCVPQAVVSASMTTSVKFSHTVFNVPLLGLNNCSDLLQSRDLWPRTSYLNSACCKNKIPLASVHDEQIRTTKSRNDFNYSSSEFFDVTNAFRLMSFLLRMLLREFSGERCKKRQWRLAFREWKSDSACAAATQCPDFDRWDFIRTRSVSFTSRRE